MVLFRAENRLPVDPRFLVIDDPADFSLFRERKELKLNGILYPYNVFTPKDDQVIRDFALANYRASSGDADYIKIPSIELPSMEGGFISKEYKGILATLDLPSVIENTLAFSVDAYRRAMAESPCSTQLRCNSDYPQVPHIHAPALTFSFNRSGTVIYIDSLKTHTIPAKCISIFDEEVVHIGPQLSETRNDPRVNLVVG